MMKNKIKMITTVCATMLLAFSLVGCGGDEIEINSWDNKDVKQNSAITYNPDESEDVGEESTSEESETIESTEEGATESGSLFKFGSTDSDEEQENNSVEDGNSTIDDSSVNDNNQDAEIGE